MENWQTMFLGLKQLPRELSAFEIEAFFTFSEAERATIETRRRSELQLGLALQIGFLRMSGRLLDALRMVPPALWRHLGAQFSITPPELASLRALYRRAQTLREHHQIACKALGFRWMSEHERRTLLGTIREELARTGDRNRLGVRGAMEQRTDIRRHCQPDQIVTVIRQWKFSKLTETGSY